MRKLIAFGIMFLSILGFHCEALAWVRVPDKGDTGWRNYSYTAGSQGFSGTAGFVVSNVIDNSAYSELLLDNLSQGGAGNNDFEQGTYSGFNLLGDSCGEVISSFVMAVSGNIYTPIQGDFMSHQFCLAPGVDTSAFRNSYGQPGTSGSILETAISLAPGERFTFDWAFLAGDQSPYRDFVLFYLKDGQGKIVFTDGLAEIGLYQNPAIAELLLN